MSDILVLTLGIALLALAMVYLRRRMMSFWGQNPSDYMGFSMDFDPRIHLDGQLLAEGVIYGPTGRVTSRFHADMVGEWNDDGGSFAVTLHYDGGLKQERTWVLEFTGPDTFVARAEDVDGAGCGSFAGPAMRTAYKLQLPADVGGHKLKVVDWMYLTETGTIINRTQFRKYGLLVAELVASIRKRPETE
ncbi:DUF3833 family protein [Palleronia caenipelagi]|uniref:DUF3833 domain-containing protein n=1 Tax=Palleronia caenipelagi TaxID=2489174 RepID=A0A547Q7B8_9RHOB|nr:DUF3833 family protein [Palleronia caenipelagi]TRD22259.1 DUF3833 domain-containing protein [Palleronia caenipelagi]